MTDLTIEQRLPLHSGGVDRQKTLKNQVRCAGIGLHSGAATNMILRPAPANTGIIFRRTDVHTHNDIPALWHNVVDTKLCTVIGNKAGVTVSTVEHLMSALWATEIDNVIIDIDGPEVPIMDGSAAPFLFLIECAGIKPLETPRRTIRILQPITVTDGDKTASFAPSDEYSIDFHIDFDTAIIGPQSFQFEENTGGYKRDISRARTFGFLRDVDQLRAIGLAKGGSLDNAIVIDNDKIMNKGGLRYNDEFVRHKILDCIGDLYLAGARIQGSVNAVKSGHQLNNALLHALFENDQAWGWTNDLAIPQTMTA